MFGYIVVNKSELKFKEYDQYYRYYCGLCRRLKERHGRKAQLSLSFDMTFLVLLLTGLYEPEEVKGFQRCTAHPLQKHEYLYNWCTDYVADMNIILSYYKCMDDYVDEKKRVRRLYGQLLFGKRNPLRQEYEKKINVMAENMAALSKAEKEGSMDLDFLAGCFGNILAELFAVKEDQWQDELRTIGYYLGKYIYILDAYDDLEEDKKKGRFNPFLERENLDQWVREILQTMAAIAAKEFEKLPVLENVEILRNILYSGIWTRYEQAQKRRNKKNERSL